MTSICQCEFDSQTAFIITNSSETPNKTITITEYIKNKTLQKMVQNGNQFLVCNVGNEVIKCKPKTRKSYFKHKNCDADNKMTAWHREWQNYFDVTEKTIGTRRADAVVNDTVLEFQYSQISRDNVNGRMNNYRDYHVYWIIEGDNGVEVDWDIITFTTVWKYESFIDVDFIYLHHGDTIFRIKPASVKSNMVNINACMIRQEFIDGITSNTLTWIESKTETGTIYLNQRGAGSGKTYESIQLIDKDVRFNDKEVFIYLTKMHSAKEVIYRELVEQYDKGELPSLNLNKATCAKQYLIKCSTKETETTLTKRDIKIYIGTIDSFAYAVTNQNTISNDYFTGLIKDIKAERIPEQNGGKVKKSGAIQYARNTTKLNRKCLIVIDEAQDLDKDYIVAFDKIVKYTGIDIYVIGDKLQSIFSENNVYTYLESNNVTTTIERASITNCVKRFHNERFKDFVNNIIDFDKYGLPKIEEICTDTVCKYKHHERKPYTIFTIEKIYAGDYDMSKIKKVTMKIIGYVKHEVEVNHYSPENFMFIFPILKKNVLAVELESRLQEYWINKFKDPEYTSHLSKWWRKKQMDSKYHQYVVFHKSEEGKPINLRQSEHATRIRRSSGRRCTTSCCTANWITATRTHRGFLQQPVSKRVAALVRKNG